MSRAAEVDAGRSRICRASAQPDGPSGVCQPRDRAPTRSNALVRETASPEASSRRPDHLHQAPTPAPGHTAPPTPPSSLFTTRGPTPRARPCRVKARAAGGARAPQRSSCADESGQRAMRNLSAACSERCRAGAADGHKRDGPRAMGRSRVMWNHATPTPRPNVHLLPCPDPHPLHTHTHTCAPSGALGL